ncbi:MAG TPA: PAS domain S-box protein [Candidatus Polarisedimenticolia bacterium]|nr:PAS domain S-box protein [Candidatus Polarisedimenticolia bacterium]
MALWTMHPAAMGAWEETLGALMADPLGRLLLAVSFFALALVALLLIIVPLVRRSIQLTFRRLVQGVDEIRQVGPGRQLPMNVSEEARDLVAGLNHLLGELRDRIVALERQRDEMKAILDTPRDFAVIATDPQGHVTLLSEGAARQLGYRPEELIGRSVEALFPEDEWDRIIPKLARRSLRETGLVQRVRLLRKDRSTFPAELSVSEGSFPGEAGGYVSIFRDVTEQAALDRKLHEAEERYGGLVEGLGEAVVLLQSGRIVTASRTLEELLGIPAKDLVGRPFKEFLVAEDLLRTLDLLDKILVEGGRREFDFPMRRAGSSVAREVRGFFSRLEHQGSPALLGVLRDETDRRQSERELAASRALLESSLDSTSDGILVVENGGAGPAPLIVNSRFEEMLGIDGREVMSWSVERLARELARRSRQADSVATLFEASGEEKGVQEIELAGEDHRILEVCWGPYRNPRGEISGRVTSWRDITGRRRAEDSLRESHRALAASQKELQDSVAELRSAREDLTSRNAQLETLNEELRSVDAMKSNLLANVSHELQTPLVLIKGYTEMILKRKIGPLTPEQEKGLTVALRNIDRLVEMIDNLLDFSKMERGDASLQLEEFPLWQVVDETIELVREKIRAKGIYVTTEYETDDLDVKADRGKISQVFINLLSNAVKFNREGGRITLRVKAGDRGMVDVEVQDTGIGIPPEAQGRIFDRFYQVDSSARKNYEGTGIGLSIVKEILAMHGCDIRVESRVGEGTRFAFTLPRASSRSDQRREAPRPAPANSEKPGR